MLKEQAKLFSRLSIFVDVLILPSAMGLAYAFRAHWGGLRPFHHYAWIVFFAFVVWYVLLSRYGLYASIRRRGLFNIVTSLAKVHLWGGAILATIIYLIEPRDFSRGLFLSFLLFSFLLLSVERLALRLGLGYIRKRGYNFRNILIVGTREKAKKFNDLIVDHADWGIQMLGFVQVEPDSGHNELPGQKVLGKVENLIEICKKHPVDEVVFCLPKSFTLNAEKYLKDLEELGITIRMVLDFYEVSHAKTELSLFHNEVPILTFHSKSFDAQQLFLKRILDILGSLLGLAITVALFPFIVLAIKRDSPGPVFFGQARVGASGRTFICWKFRTMYLDAEERKKELLARNEMNGAIFKIKDDPRITRVGRFLRMSSLDELPQFWNVLRGEMSLVGTRPPTPDEVSRYDNWHRRRISIKPGITGLWQVSGRSNIRNFDEVVRLDLQYIDNWSLWLDMKIILKTLRIVCLGTGSC